MNKVAISEVAKLPTVYGDFNIVCFKEELANHESKEHLILYTQTLGPKPLVRLHSECLTGDVFHSRKCDCGFELEWFLKEIGAPDNTNGGMVVYLRQEGRGIGLFNKVNAYALQDQGLDTVEANLQLGFMDDERNYSIIPQIITHFQLKEIYLYTNNPLKVQDWEKYITVTRKPIIQGMNCKNVDYLRVKKEKMNHML